MTLDRPYSILVTDDDPASRETFREIFEPVGFRTFLAESGEEAIDIVHRHDVHLALMDMHLPEALGPGDDGDRPPDQGDAADDPDLGRPGREPDAPGPLGPGLQRAGQAGEPEPGHLHRASGPREVLLSRPSMRRSLAASLLILGVLDAAVAHDIPNARVDRSIQATLEPGQAPGRLRGQPRRADAHPGPPPARRRAPGADRRGWFEATARRPARSTPRGCWSRSTATRSTSRSVGFDLVDRGPPALHLPLRGRAPPERPARPERHQLRRPARGPAAWPSGAVGGVAVRGDSLPTDVDPDPDPPGLATERRRGAADPAADGRLSPPASVPGRSTSGRVAADRSRPRPPPRRGLSRLLDDRAGRAWPALLLAAFVLGAAHAIQPGHGKTLVAASSLGPGGGPFRGALLGLATATAHLASVALIALALWMTRSARLGEIHLALARLGRLRDRRHRPLAARPAPGGFRRARGGRGPATTSTSGASSPSAWPAGSSLAGTPSPWSSSPRRSAGSRSGLTLLAAFSLGMAAVLVAVGAAAEPVPGGVRSVRAAGRLGAAARDRGGLILAAIGLYAPRCVSDRSRTRMDRACSHTDLPLADGLVGTPAVGDGVPSRVSMAQNGVPSMTLSSDRPGVVEARRTPTG